MASAMRVLTYIAICANICVVVCSGFSFRNTWRTVSALTQFAADIIVSCSNETFPTRSATFGPTLTQIVEQSLTKFPDDGCDNSSMNTNDLEYEGKVVLVPRGNCSFEAKIRHIQELGGIAVIIGDNISRDWLFTICSDGCPYSKAYLI